MYYLTKNSPFDLYVVKLLNKIFKNDRGKIEVKMIFMLYNLKGLRAFSSPFNLTHNISKLKSNIQQNV